MKVNKSQVTSQKRQLKNNHSQYFASLENKLLQQSDTLTNFMGKSLINQKSLKQLRYNLSTRKLHTQQASQSGRLSSSKQLKQLPKTKYSQSYIQRAKYLVDYVKFAGKSLKSKEIIPVKDRYQQLRKVVYSVCKNNKEQRDKTLVTDESNTINNTKKYSKFTNTSNSLKQTISTSSGLSYPILNQQIIHTNIKLDDFQPIKILGKGKMGQVCLVISLISSHKRTNFIYALKQIPKSQISQDKKMLMQIIRQIKVQSFMDHPNIVQLYNVFVQQGNLYLLMELCADGDLYQYLKELGSLSQEKIRNIVKQICYAVQYMHDNDIIHRDLKPQNILFHQVLYVFRQNIVKICDFGWAVHSPLLRDTLCGTPLYTSPELVQKQQYDNKIDIWNIGILTYQLAYGRVPFEIRSQDDVIKVVDEQIYFPRSKPASPQIKDFIMRCLSKNPKERFTIAKLIDHQFLNIVQNGGKGQ